MNCIHKSYVSSFLFKDNSEVIDWESLVDSKTIDGRGFFHYDQLEPELKANIKRIVLKENNGSCTFIAFEMPVLSISEIKNTYSGKPGCMCGCLGEYRYTKAGISEAPDYYSPETREESTNESAVKRAYNTMVKLAKSFGVEVITNEKRTVGKGDIFVIDFSKYRNESTRRKALYLLEA